ncbi:MAG: hypothetical protein EXS46_01670 [Candidatus Taylorbacteria bacterium]|nr:hypothetical protein [Candidatus Taylorbacteria bacterium]
MSLGSENFCKEFDEAHRGCNVPDCGSSLMNGQCYVRPGGKLVELCEEHTRLANENGIRTMGRDEYLRQQQVGRGESPEQLAIKRAEKVVDFLKGK